MKKIMLVFGTRPEAIKMCPLVNELKRRETIVCVTEQHRQMLERILETFQVVLDYDLSIMKDNRRCLMLQLVFWKELRGVRGDNARCCTGSRGYLYNVCKCPSMFLLKNPCWTCKGRIAYI